MWVCVDIRAGKCIFDIPHQCVESQVEMEELEVAETVAAQVQGQTEREWTFQQMYMLHALQSLLINDQQLEPRS